MSSSFITSRVLRGLDSFAGERGVDLASLASETGVSMLAAADDDALIPFQGFMKLLDLAAETSGTESFGLEFGVAHASTSAGLFNYLVMSTPTLEDTLITAARYIGLVTDGYSHSVDTDGDILYFSWLYSHPASVRVQYTAYAVGLTVARLRKQIEPGWQPVGVDFDLVPPRDPRRFALLLGRNVKFRQPRTRIGADRASLDRKLATEDPRLFELLENMGRKKLGLPKSQTALVREAAEIIRKTLPRGKESIQTTATELGMSVRSLQTAMAEAGITYRELVDEVRQGMARQLITETDLPLAAIALFVGFSEISAFSRAAKKWFDEVPSAMRKRHRAPVEP